MMKRLLVSVILVGALATPALAAEQPFQQRTWELTLESDFDNGFVPRIGYYVMDNLAVSALAMFDKSELKISGVKDTTTEQRLGLGLDFNIPTGTNVVPFVGVAVEYINLEEDDGVTPVIKVSGPAVDISGGVKILVGARGSVNLGLNYTTATLDSTVGGVSGPDTDVNDFSGTVGYSLYFR